MAPKKVNVVKTQFQRVLEAGPHVKILFKGEKKAFADLVADGSLNILLLNEKTIFEKSVRKMFEKNEGLVFYRSVYVDHLVKIIHLLKMQNYLKKKNLYVNQRKIVIYVI